MRFTFPLICLSSGLACLSLVCGPLSCLAADTKPSAVTGPRLILAMQAPSTTVAPAVPAPDPASDAPGLSTAKTLTAPPALPLSSTLLQWGRQERRAERRQTQFHPLRRLLSLPGRVILTPYAHPVASSASDL